MLRLRLRWRGIRVRPDPAGPAEAWPRMPLAAVCYDPPAQCSAISASTATSTSRRGRIPGSRRSSAGLGVPVPRLERADHRRVLRAERRRAHPRRRATASSGSSTTTPGSASTSARRCSPGWSRRRRTSTRAILEADAESRERFGGHGSAIAQAYNHMILPLANQRDKRTQVRWGIADFERRFGRKPEGMWLPETAVDLETLEVLAEEGIRFTDPRAAPGRGGCGRWRRGTRSGRTSAAAGSIRRMPYQCKLPSGAAIAIFFYDGADLAGGGVRGAAGERRALRRPAAGRGARDAGARPQLVHIATDGETYGHHHRYGDMALAYALAPHRGATASPG